MLLYTSSHLLSTHSLSAGHYQPIHCVQPLLLPPFLHFPGGVTTVTSAYANTHSQIRVTYTRYSSVLVDACCLYANNRYMGIKKHKNLFERMQCIFNSPFHVWFFSICSFRLPVRIIWIPSSDYSGDTELATQVEYCSLMLGDGGELDPRKSVFFNLHTDARTHLESLTLYRFSLIEAKKKNENRNQKPRTLPSARNG